MDGRTHCSAALQVHASSVLCWTKCVFLDQMVSSSSQIPPGAESGPCSEPGGEHEAALRVGVPVPIAGACRYDRYLFLSWVPVPITDACPCHGYLPLSWMSPPIVDTCPYHARHDSTCAWQEWSLPRRPWEARHQPRHPRDRAARPRKQRRQTQN